MTKKHKIRKSKHLLQNKKDVDENVENILRMIGEENEQAENEQDNSVNSLKKSKLSSLVKGFHADYQYLHKHYKQLISKLENFGHSSSGSDSSDSDLEGDRSENSVTTLASNEENSRKHKVGENHSLEEEVEKLKQNTVEQANEISVLNSNIADLQKEKSCATSEIKQLEASLMNLENELSRQLERISDMQNTIERLAQANSNLHNENAEIQGQKNEAAASIANLEGKIEQQAQEILDLHEANKNLKAAKTDLCNEALHKLQQSNASIMALEVQLEQQREQLSALQLANEDMQKSNSNLKLRLEEAKVSHHVEILALEDKKNEVVSQLQQCEACTENLRIELEQGKEQISRLQLANGDLENSNASLEKQLNEVRRNLHAEIAALHGEKDAVLSELQTSQASVRNYESTLENQRENISTLQQSNDELQKNICTLSEQSEQAKAELQKEVKVTQEEKDTALTQLKMAETSIKNLENKVAHLMEKLSVQLENNSALDKQLGEAILKVSTLHDNLEKAHAEAACQIDDMSTKTKDLEKTINLLSSQKTKVEEDLKITIESCTYNMSFVKEFEDRVKQRITDHETRLAILQQNLGGAVSSFRRLHYSYDEVSTRAFQLEILKGDQIEQICQLENKNAEIIAKHQLLEEEKLYANKENTRLQKHVQELEVQLQLAMQKLNVTEAENKCNKDSFALAMETAQAKIQQLEQLVHQFSGRVSLLEETLVQVKEHVESGVSKLVDKLDELESLCDQSFVRFVESSSACNEDIKVLRKRLNGHLNEQKELVKENSELAVKLREKEKTMSMMVKNAAEAEQKMLQLEKTAEEKEEELAARVQEKREAIKQLSDAIIYHKNNSDDLVRYIRSHNRSCLPFCL